MRILGLNGNVHDSSVCLLEDGRIRYAVEEERLNRQKHFGGVPEMALAEVERLLGGSLDGVEWVVIPWLPGRYLRYGIVSNLPRLLSRPALHGHALVDAVDQYIRYRNMEKRYALAPRRLATVDHHRAHAASAYYVSPFDEAAVLTYDARGEDVSTALWHGRGNDLRLVERIPMPHSLGHLYAQITRYLGFGPNDEYKVMGLAGYGSPRFKPFFDRLCRLRPDGTYRIDRSFLDYYRGYSAPLLALGPPRGEGEPIGDFHRDVAASLQAKFEEVALSLATSLRRRTGAKYLCVAGGCGLNGVANGRLLREAGYQDLYVQPAAGDSGLAIGAAVHLWNGVLGRPRGFVMDRVDYGPSYDDDAILSFLRKAKLPHERLEDVPGVAADLIVSGKVIGWFQGRVEMGPRALGHRSILADPRDPQMKDRVNRMIKNREGFRPFAPAVPVERVGEWFEADRPLPFMIVVLPVRPEARARLPAITHVDGTARIQTVSEGTNPLFHALLQAIGGRTGIPVVLNSSFNLQGEPIVCTPADAARTFYSSGLDALVIGSFLLRKAS